MSKDTFASPAEMSWKLFKQTLDAWDAAASPLFEAWLKSPFVVHPAGSVLTQMTQLKRTQRKLSSMWWSSFGLPTRSEQERTLHALNELSSRLIDLEDKLSALEHREEKV